MQSWLSVIATAIAVVLLSSVPLSAWLLVPTIAMMAALMQVQIFHTRQLAKSFWLSTYLRTDSPVRNYVRRSALLRLLAIGIAIPLSILTYITVYSYGISDCIAISISIVAAKRIHAAISKPVDDNIADHLVELAHIRIYYWLSIILVLVGLALASVLRSFSIDYSNATGDQIATIVIDEIKHPVKFVQHCVRTLRYSELQVLRVRDINGWPYGWLIYVFFLFPNALPAFGLVTLYAGCERIFTRRNAK